MLGLLLTAHWTDCWRTRQPSCRAKTRWNYHHAARHRGAFPAIDRRLIGWYQEGQSAGFTMSLIGTLILLGIYHPIAQDRVVVPTLTSLHKPKRGYVTPLFAFSMAAGPVSRILSAAPSSLSSQVAAQRRREPGTLNTQWRQRAAG